MSLGCLFKLTLIFADSFSIVPFIIKPLQDMRNSLFIVMHTHATLGSHYSNSNGNCNIKSTNISSS